jgi:hypothetical protein
MQTVALEDLMLGDIGLFLSNIDSLEEFGCNHRMTVDELVNWFYGLDETVAYNMINKLIDLGDTSNEED